MKSKQEVIQEAWEQWKPCSGYEGFYEVSTFGNIRSIRKNKILKPTKNKYGYCKVSLTGDNSYKTVNVHRVIAQTFIPNPENKPQVNHKDGNKANNRVDNLEWSTREENMQHAHLNGLMNLPSGNRHCYFNIKSDLHPRAKALINVETKEIYGCIKDCAKVLNIKEGTLRGWLNEPRINPTKIVYLDYYKSNNGWTRIESEEDLPKDRIDIWVISNGKVFYYNDFEPDNDRCKKYVCENYSHYQPIIKPEAPIY
ncbi:NUMOD4 motif-containing HNH endonuclease [Sphingobacterium sp.]|uniref:NUMOD4 motif-containing HNH endonuclease n=1 Tax=Sphingobacterium sp. TaxID=341027 RepID=UPI002899A57D|nr:NUMOD4 motif-containing HNH endonuclease [Sphingobacterium sp.]